jgi:hypothetical protein
MNLCHTVQEATRKLKLERKRLKLFYTLKSVFQIHDILLRIQIRILGPYTGIMDPDPAPDLAPDPAPDPALLFSNFQEANKK